MRRCNFVTQENLRPVSLLFTLKEQPFGRSWEEWATKWWQWFLSMPIDNNPAYDITGEKANVNQPYPNVWFLAGTTGGTAERTITVPVGKAILVPIINITTSYLENPNLRTEGDMAAYVNSHMKDIVKKEASIDGEDLLISDNYRVRCPTFSFFFPKNNIYGVHEGRTKGTGDGYWLFIKPLSRGTHTIRTSGACMSGKIKIDTNIKLIIE